MSAVGVEIRNVALAYGATPVLRDISLAVAPGEFFALLGPSGSGKSTLLRLIAGFNRQQSGTVLIGERDVGAVPPWKRNVGMVFQNYALWPHMTVERNVAFGLEERRRPREEIRARVAAALELVGLAGLGSRRPGQLSGGQQQRVALARTLAIEPQVLLLDEPLSNLDAKLRVQMRRELRRLHEKLGITTIFVTHDQEEALTMCDRIAVMEDGVVQQVGTPNELFDHPANRFVAQFVGSVNLFEGEIRRDRARLVFASPVLGEAGLPEAATSLAEGRAEIAFRPHAVVIDGADAPDGLLLEGAVEDAEFLGEFVRYEVRVGSAVVLADDLHRRGGKLLEKGATVRLAIPWAEVRVMR
jgi:iron(III) transport system ATP-binding protein